MRKMLSQFQYYMDSASDTLWGIEGAWGTYKLSSSPWHVLWYRGVEDNTEEFLSCGTEGSA